MTALDSHGPGGKPPGPSAIATWFGGHATMQIVAFVLLVTLFGALAQNLLGNMARVGITPGFAFLSQPANFAIGESLIDYTPQSSFGRAIVVGILNTLLVSTLGCLLATVVGVALGIARLSSNPLLSGSVRVYVEAMRNTPLLLQLFFWTATLQALPGARQALNPLPGIFLSNRALFLPVVRPGEGASWAALVGIVVVALLVRRLATWRLRNRPRRRQRANLVLLFGTLALLVGAAVLGGFGIEVPSLKGFNMVGGLALSTEFSALLIGLVLNSAAGISEIVRSGILSVPKGQWEAGRSIGLSSAQIMRLVVLPQALRVIVPLMTSSYLSLTKNSSLAVAIGYPDLVSIVNTTANQTGQALEAIVIMVAVYLTISFGVSWLMNLYDARQRLRER